VLRAALKAFGASDPHPAAAWAGELQDLGAL